MDPNVCPKCRGAQWLREDVPFGHLRFGALVRCECLIQQDAKKRLSESRKLSQLFGLDDKSFENFDSDILGVSDAFAVARRYAEDPEGWLVMSGKVGSGKTHLAVAIVNARLAAGENAVIFAVVPDLLDHLRATFDPSLGITYDKRFEEFRSAVLLVLDDLGTENTTPWAKEKLFQIINHRYNERLPTVITTNRRVNEIDERIVSRMLDGSLSQALTFDRAEDFRRKKSPTYVRGRSHRSFG